MGLCPTTLLFAQGALGGVGCGGAGSALVLHSADFRTGAGGVLVSRAASAVPVHRVAVASASPCRRTAFKRKSIVGSVVAVFAAADVQTSPCGTTIGNSFRNVIASLLFGAWLKLRQLVSGPRMGKPFRRALRRIRLLQLPREARHELALARESLWARSRNVPQPFRAALSQAAGQLEDVPTFLLEVSLLAGSVAGSACADGSVGEEAQPLDGARRLAEALSLLFAAGRFHELHREGSGPMKLLGGDYLYAEGQWVLALLGSLPVIKLSIQTVLNFSDGAAAEIDRGDAQSSDPKLQLLAASCRTGAFFATAAGGAAWLSAAPKETVLTLYQYGRDLGCALELVRGGSKSSGVNRGVLLAATSQLARHAVEASNGLEQEGRPKEACRGLRRLARAVETESALAAAAFFKDAAIQESAQRTARVLLDDFRAQCIENFSQLHFPGPPVRPQPLRPLTLGLDRTAAADQEVRSLIAAGLKDVSPSRPQALPVDGTDAALQKSLACVALERHEVETRLESGSLSSRAISSTVREETARMLRCGGKRLRSTLTLLVGKSLGAGDEAMGRIVSLAIAVEVLHSAALVHDDILDSASLRRGSLAVHKRCGEVLAVFAGDYLFAIASALIAEIGSVDTVALISKIVADLGRGELSQSAARYKVDRYSLTDYLSKSFHKTASLLAAACQASAVLGGGFDVSAVWAEACYRYGMYLGLAFQVVDDVLDFTGSDDTLGKPALADLKSGYYSAPVLLALESKEFTAAERAEFKAALDGSLSDRGDFNRTLAWIERAHGIERSMDLARRFAELAVQELKQLPVGEARTCLETFADFVVARRY